MNMMEKIQSMMNERGLKPSDVSKGADIAYSTFDSMCELHTTYATLRGGCFLLKYTYIHSINRLSP